MEHKVAGLTDCIAVNASVAQVAIAGKSGLRCIGLDAFRRVIPRRADVVPIAFNFVPILIAHVVWEKREATHCREDWIVSKFVGGTLAVAKRKALRVALKMMQNASGTF